MSIKSKRKICIIVASRANYGRIKSVLQEVQNHPKLELQLIVSASALLPRFGNVIDVIKQDGFTPSAKVNLIIEGETPVTMAKSTGLGIVELSTIFENLQPDIVITVADRFETIATAITASYMNIAVAHLQGGEESGSIDESVRHAITKLSHIHFPATKKSVETIIKMGEDPKMVFFTGCPSIDIISKINFSRKLNDVMEPYGGVGATLDWTKPYLLVVQHPVTTEYPEGFNQIEETLKAVNELKIQTIWLWPNVDAGSDGIAKGIRTFREKHKPEHIHFYRNFSVEDYGYILNHALCIIGNSSSGIREGAFLGVPCINIGTRQQSRERSQNVSDVDYNKEAIMKATKEQMDHGKYNPDYLFGDGTAGKKIAKILATVKPKIQKQLCY